jgi:hypothetical protein
MTILGDCMNFPPRDRLLWRTKDDIKTKSIDEHSTSALIERLAVDIAPQTAPTR